LPLPLSSVILRRLHDATIGKLNPAHSINITESMDKDLEMWELFLSSYNGKTIISTMPSFSSKELHMYSDSCKAGYGATFGDEYLCGKFPVVWQEYSIEILELYPIFLLLHIFHHKLRHNRVTFHCDNLSVVHIINKQSSKVKEIMSLLRPMILLMLKNKISFRAVHIPGIQNNLCDALSRSQVTPTHLKELGMKYFPTDIPQSLRPQNLRLASPTS